MAEVFEKAKVWEQDVAIPTYPVGAPDKNPMFLEKRVYQGSSGKVYPHSVIDKIYDEKIEKTYRAVFLENKYLKIMFLPELGGRVQRATDKTNGYDFVYYNQVIKPALVGLAGPWISGGIEFNWPQHHRPSTFDPVDYYFEENPDGSCTVWMGEIENMFRTKGMAGFTLYPDKAYLEISVQLYNRTPLPQTFLWWANPAVSVNDYTQSVFPPDVTAVMDHGKRDVSTFPIATGIYYKMDYSAGVDISRYKNIPVPTSYMAYHSDYDFVGGYDYGKQAGILHVANHHVSPGKKQWTWGCGEFGKAWDRNLTDEDGPYIELMTGCFTDNQPDFTWLAPYEEKVFKQYFMPYKNVGMVKNATIEATVGLEVDKNFVYAKAYATAEYPNARVILSAGEKIYLDETVLLSPQNTFEAACRLEDGTAQTSLTLSVLDCTGRELVSYTPKEKGIDKIPEPAKAAPLPQDAKTLEDLYLYGLHIEQYRHATYDAADYYREGLRRDATDIRLNNAYGKLLLNRGLFAESEQYFRAAIEKSTRSNPNPYDSEPFYNFGLSLKYQGKIKAAYDAFYKATWSGAWQESGFYQLACIDSMTGDYKTALEHVERSLIKGQHNMKSRNLKTALLRKLGYYDKAKSFIAETISIDRMDFGSRYESAFLASDDEKTKSKILKELHTLLHGNFNACIEISIDYAEAGFYNEAIEILEDFCRQFEDKKQVYPMVYYHLAANYAKIGNLENTQKSLKLAFEADGSYCFPHRLEDIAPLEYAMQTSPRDSKAPYYLGNLWYDKKQYDKAAECWKISCTLDDNFPTAHRNLSLYYFNKKKDPQKALAEMEKAYALDESDARVLLELDQLYKKIGKSPAKRLEFLEKHFDVVSFRDDLYLEYITLHNFAGNNEKAKSMLETRNFHPWEGGEGKVPAQYLLAHAELAKKAIKRGDFEKAAELMQKALGEYPHNLGEGKLYGSQENNLNYILGCAYEGMDLPDKAAECFEKAAVGLSEPAGMMFYNDQPPEMIYYQGLALMKLGRKDAAFSRFNKLIAYGKKHYYDEVRLDYFAVSFPDLMIFDEDLNVRNRLHCLFMMLLGYLGKGEKDEALRCLEEIRQIDPNHAGVRFHADVDIFQ